MKRPVEICAERRVERPVERCAGRHEVGRDLRFSQIVTRWERCHPPLREEAHSGETSYHIGRRIPHTFRSVRAGTSLEILFSITDLVDMRLRVSLQDPFTNLRR